MPAPLEARAFGEVGLEEHVCEVLGGDGEQNTAALTTTTTITIIVVVIIVIIIVMMNSPYARPTW